MKKEIHRKCQKSHRETSKDDPKESTKPAAQDSSEIEQNAANPANPFSRFAHFIKGTFQKQKKAPIRKQSPELPPTSAKQQKPEFDGEVKRLMASDDDAVNKLYQLDLILRRYYGKEYKIGKKLQYLEMIEQLEEKQETAASSLLKKIIAYAYSGKPLENPQIRELLSDFQQLVAANTTQHAAEEESHRKKKDSDTPIEAQEALADKLTTIAPQLPPRSEPFVHLPSLDVQKYRRKLQNVLEMLAKIRPQKIFTGVKLPSVIQRNQQKKPEPQSPKQPSAPHTMPLHLRLPQLRLPIISKSDVQKTDVRHSVSVAVHAARLHLPKVRLPEFNRHESHAPRVKLPSWRIMKENIVQKVATMQLPQLRLPELSSIHLPHFTNPDATMTQTQPIRPHLPKAKPLHRHFRISSIKKLLHLPRFHSELYYERIKEHVLEMHPIEYARSFADHIPRPHPREYYESLKQTAQETWEKIHPPKLSEEEQALQAELEQEQIEQQAQITQPEKISETLETEAPASEAEETLLTPKPMIVKPETYWVEYRPRKHARGVEHHIAFSLDDFHHVKEIIRKHHKAALV